MATSIVSLSEFKAKAATNAFRNEDCRARDRTDPARRRQRRHPGLSSPPTPSGCAAHAEAHGAGRGRYPAGRTTTQDQVFSDLKRAWRPQRMADFQVLWTDAARLDLEGLIEFIAEENPAERTRGTRADGAPLPGARRPAGTRDRIVPELRTVDILTYREQIEGPWRNRLSIRYRPRPRHGDPRCSPGPVQPLAGAAGPLKGRTNQERGRASAPAHPPYPLPHRLHPRRGRGGSRLLDHYAYDDAHIRIWTSLGTFGKPMRIWPTMGSLSLMPRPFLPIHWR